MRNFPALLGRELLSVFVSPLAWGTAAAFLFLFGLVFVGQFTQSRLVEARTILDPLGYLLPVLAAPALTMRLLAEERRLGTFEMLMTAPVGDAEVVLAKFAGVWIFYAAILALTGLHVCAMLCFYDGNVDWGSFFTSYLGALLSAGLFLAWGLFVSGLFESPILAALVAFIGGLTALLAGYILSAPVVLELGLGAKLLDFLLPFQHYRVFLRGLVDTRDAAYFLLGMGYFLFLSVKVVESRKWV